MENGETWIHKESGKAYMIVEKNARMKIPETREWVDCVAYRPLYGNQYGLFARETNSFMEEFKPDEHDTERCCRTCRLGYDKYMGFVKCKIMDFGKGGTNKEIHVCDEYSPDKEQPSGIL
jgi:hypothetical protein